MTEKIVSKRFLIIWGIVLLFCLSPLGVIVGVLAFIPLITIVAYLSLSSRAVCKWIYENPEDCWFSLTHTDINQVDWSAASVAVLACYGLVIAYVFFRAYRASDRGQKERAIRLQRVGLNLILIGLAVFFAVRITLMASSGM